VGPWINSNLGPSLSLPSTFPFPSSSQAQPLSPAAKRPQIQLGGLGERCRPKLCQQGRSGAEPQPKSKLVHFSLKIRHLVATILMIFLKVLPKIFLWPHYSGAPEARWPRFIEPPEPRFLRHRLMMMIHNNDNYNYNDGLKLIVCQHQLYCGSVILSSRIRRA